MLLPSCHLTIQTEVGEKLHVCFFENSGSYVFFQSIKRCMIDLNYNRKLYNHVVKYYDFIWMKNNGISVTDLFPDLTFR